MTRGQAIAAFCRQCIGDPGAAGTWREQVAICACRDCPLWRFRPLPRNAPAWIASRKAADMPAGFHRVMHDAAIARLRGNIDASTNGARVLHAPLSYRHRGATGVAGAGEHRQNARASGGEHADAT